MRFLRNSALALAALFLAIGLSLTPGDEALFPPQPGEPSFQIHVVDHGWHTGLILSTTDIAAIALTLPEDQADEASNLLSLARIMAAAEWVEIGWGDEGFYQADVAGPADAPILTSLRALFLATPTVLHVFPGLGPPHEAFPESRVLALDLSEEGFRRLALAIARDFAARDGFLRDEGPGLYGFARFYAAQGAYTIMKTCNNWAAERLRAAGVPASWSTSAFSAGLMAELRLRTR